jgi:beta-lactamase class A
MIRKQLFLRVVITFILVFILCLQWGLQHHSRVVEDTLSRYITEKIAAEDFKVAVVIRQLEPGSIYRRLANKNISLEIDAREKFSAASLIKVPVMAACFMAEREGKLDLTAPYTLQDADRTGGSGILKAAKAGKKFTYLKLIELMITKSDNTATNILMKKLGFDYLNRSFARLGLTATEVNRPVLDLVSRRKGIDNFVSAADIASLYERMYKGRLVDHQASRTMLGFLSNQKVNDRLPRELPDDIEIAHKTGTIRGVVHDAGIVFSPGEDYLICVLTQGARGYKGPKDFIAEISEMTYYLLTHGD